MQLVSSLKFQEPDCVLISSDSNIVRLFIQGVSRARESSLGSPRVPSVFCFGSDLQVRCTASKGQFRESNVTTRFSPLATHTSLGLQEFFQLVSRDRGFETEIGVSAGIKGEDTQQQLVRSSVQSAIEVVGASTTTTPRDNLPEPSVPLKFCTVVQISYVQGSFKIRPSKFSRWLVFTSVYWFTCDSFKT